ncbi:hypothetical protein SELMODRAFT_427736 [Selaginella moellendorffii]|uniref:Guanylate cyclase domain-containing protein n=1 Tax=Selaginella moellendorffii TaxID=88036 RepID=D8T0K1_SELML|nr:hypothetical protein SELMODRAFT_427736 [Selaginella moellendorffii]
MEHKRPSIIRISKPRHSLLIQEEVLAAKVDVVGRHELEGLWQELDSWSFDIFKVATEDLPKMAERIFVNLGLLTTLPLDVQKLKAFIESCRTKVFLVDYQGYESMNILGIFPDSEQRHIRKLIVSCILATDMAYHGAVVQSFSLRSKEVGSFHASSRYEYQPPPPPKKVPCKVTGIFEMEEQQEEPALLFPQVTKEHRSSDDVLLLMKVIMKCSDISNTIRPYPLSKKWAALLLLEWFRQGDVERRSMTLGCIDAFSIPMYEAVARVLPKLKNNVLPNLASNRESWMSFSTAGPIEQEVQVILGSFFPIEGDDEQQRQSTSKSGARSSQTGQSTMPESAQSSEGHRVSEIKKASVTTHTSPGNERPLSLLFGAPLGRDVNTLASELAWNTTLRDSSLRVNLVPSTRRSHSSGSIGSLQLGPGQTVPSERGSSLAGTINDEMDYRHETSLSLDRIDVDKGPVGFFTRLRARGVAIRVSQVLDSRVWAHFVAIPATLIALFLNDFSRAFLPKSLDTFVDVVYVICLFLFLLDLVALSVLKPAYLFSFAFWQNLIVARVWKAAESLSRLAKKLQNRSAKVPSAFLIARLAKAVFYHCIRPLESKARDDKETTEDSSNQFMSSKPSYLWLRLSDLQSQRLVLGILILAIALPYFYQLPDDLAPTLALAALDSSPLYTLRFNTSLINLNQFNNQHDYAIIYLGCRDGCAQGYCSGYEFSEGDPFIQVVPPIEAGRDAKSDVTSKYRDEELIKVKSDSRRCEAFYSIRKRSRKNHVLNLETLGGADGADVAYFVHLVCFIVPFKLGYQQFIGSGAFQPIERMVNFIKELADNPGAFVGKSISRKSRGKSGKVMETRMLEGALVKIASLSKVALGDAGMDILSVNLKGAEFNRKKIRACFGFCDIRNFTDATECLQEDVMMFVNKIADVVHSKAIMHNGFPNKNVGDAFLVVWKKTMSDGAQKSKGSSFADRALISFLDVIQALELSEVLHEYAMHPAIQQRMPGYTIKMGFGLHVGWAIEGAIGSSHKVDPSYLSPHVNMASRLEAATKQYGVMILISETVIANLTKSSLRDCCRKLDRVTVKGSADPLTLYTYDLPMFQNDLKALYADYKNMFEAAVDSYIVGNWHTALEKLRECVNLWHSDRPARLLTSFMGSHKNMVPANWKGYRELLEK